MFLFSEIFIRFLGSPNENRKQIFLLDKNTLELEHNILALKWVIFMIYGLVFYTSFGQNRFLKYLNMNLKY